MTIVKRKVESSPKKYVKYNELKPGATVIVGNYIGSTLVPNYAKDGEVPEHQFQDEDGNVTVLNSAGQLNYLLAKVEVGSLVEVVYLGKESITRKNGQKTKANQFEVSILEQTA